MKMVLYQQKIYGSCRQCPALLQMRGNKEYYCFYDEDHETYLSGEILEVKDRKYRHYPIPSNCPLPEVGIDNSLEPVRPLI